MTAAEQASEKALMKAGLLHGLPLGEAVTKNRFLAAVTKNRLPEAVTKNRLLEAVPTDARARISPRLREIDLPLGTVIYEAGQKVDYVYFPIDCIISLLYVMKNGASAEIAVVGCDGIVGIAVFLGGVSSQSRAVVQSSGSALRLPAADLNKEFNHHPELRMLMLRYTQALITQTSQTAVCNRHHTIDQQLCRWLLLSMDRLPTTELIMTQELIANMLGVRREGVTEAAGKLQKAGIIRYRRGHITVVDRSKLEERCCECYEVVKREADRLQNYVL